jgi:type III restriction enzyme
MATGAGKTKVLSLLIAWSFFHKLYEEDSALSRNFLVIAPNIIVLDRLRADFDGLRIFFNDPVLPSNGHEGRNWHDDFQLTLHIQDDVRVVRDAGNLFLTNIHRVFLGDVADPSLEDEDLRDYFLDPFGPKPVGKTTDSKTDLGEIVREVEELAVFNDEAHHIHNPKMAWFKSIQDIHHKMRKVLARPGVREVRPRMSARGWDRHKRRIDDYRQRHREQCFREWHRCQSVLDRIRE